MAEYVSRTDSEYLAERLLGLPWRDMQFFTEHIVRALDIAEGDYDALTTDIARAIIEWAERAEAGFKEREKAK